MIIYQDCDTGKYYLDNWRECDKMGNLKMTREEAVKKLSNAQIPRGIDRDYIFLDALEALGLIKFDEPELLSAQIIIDEYLVHDAFNKSRSAATLITYLKAHGYKIERI